jgi:hypothetical protein
MRQLIGDTTTKAKAFYEDTKKYQPVFSFLAGFTWDSFTLNRIDLLLDNMIMFSYIMLSGLFIYLANLAEENVFKNSLVLKYRQWYPNIIHFFFGGLFSAYVIYYFQSASLSKNGIFLFFLIVLLISNEFIKSRLSSFIFQFILYYLATFSFFIFYLPVLFKAMNAWIFILSGIISSAFIAGLIFLLYKKIADKLKHKIKNIIIIMASVYILFNLLYFTNMIPPVPLSLKEAGIFHHVQRVDEYYIAKFEKGKWYQPFKTSDSEFHFRTGDAVYCFAAVFAPTNLNTRIYHRWQLYSEKADAWQTTDRTAYQINGGRDGGYRGFTNKRNVQPGLWRVDVETEMEQLLGRVSFEVIATQDSVVLQEIIK